MIRNPFLTLLSVAVSASLSVTVYGLLADAFTDRRMPVVFHRVATLNSPLGEGEKAIVRVWRDKVRGDCPVLSRRTAVNQDGVTFDIPDAMWAGGPAGTEYIDMTYDTSFLNAGDYELRVTLDYQCPDKTYPAIQPPARFRIVRR